MSGTRHHRKRQQPERALQRAIVKHLRLRGQSGLVFFAVPKPNQLQAAQVSHADPGTSEQRWKYVRACIDKAEKAANKARDWQITAGQHLKALKAEHDDGGGTWAEWEELVKEKAGISKSRASELMAIADGTKTVEQSRAANAAANKRLRDRRSPSRDGENADGAKAAAKVAAATTEHGQKHRALSPSRDEENADDPETSAETMKAIFAASDGEAAAPSKAEPPPPAAAAADEDEDEDEDEGMPPEVVAALRMVEQMSAENRLSFTEELRNGYPDDFEDDLKDAPDLAVVHRIIEAIGVERTRALSKKMTGLIFEAVGRAALPDCEWCSGRGLRDVEFYGETLKQECSCVRRKRGEDFEALKARLQREAAEKGIPEQDFSFGLEVTTKDGKVWANGVRLPTEEEVRFYIDYWARRELRKHGYQKTYEGDEPNDLVAFNIKRYEEQPLMRIWGGKRKGMSFMHGTCGRKGPASWRPISGGECQCKMCKESRAFRAQYEVEETDDALGASDPGPTSEALAASASVEARHA
jgi:hypothetical protein